MIILIIRLTIINYTKLYDVYIDEGQCDGGILGKKKFKKNDKFNGMHVIVYLC